MKGIKWHSILTTAILVAISLGGYIFYFHAGDFANPINLIMVVAAVIVSSIISFLLSRITSVPVDDVIKSLNAIAKGDFTIKSKQLVKGDLGKLTQIYNDSLNKVQGILRDIKGSSVEMISSAGSIEQIAIRSQEESSVFETTVRQNMEDSYEKMEELKTLVSTISEMLSQMSTGVEQIASSASTASGTAVNTAELADSGKSAMSQVIDQIEKIRESSNYTGTVIKNLGESSETIGQIVETITGIADQTNLLALNAAIEAARAGEQGRGFAVVADEIRKLAEQSGSAAKQIAELIASVQNETEKAVAAKDQGAENVQKGIEVVKTAADSFEEILASVQAVANQMQEISAATEEMAASTEDTHESFKKITDITVDTSNQSQDIASSVQKQHKFLGDIASLAKNLKQTSDGLGTALETLKL